MKAIVQTGPEAIEIQEREKPDPAPEEVLVRVHAAGLCGSDVHAYRYDGGYEWISLPRIIGHEYAGTVVEVGDDVTKFTVGEHVVEEPIHHCGECFQCENDQENVCQNFSITGAHRDGAFTDFVTVDPRHLHRIPPDVPLGHAAITEPTSIATRAVFDRSAVEPGHNVLVAGPGPIGVLIAVVADSLGANVVVSGLGRDNSHRLPLLEEMGIGTIDIEANDLQSLSEEVSDGIGFDAVFDTTGHHSGVETAVDVVRKGGEVVIVGLAGEPSELFTTPVVRGEIKLNTSYGSKWRNFEQALRLMENGSINPASIIDTSFSVSDPIAAFDAFMSSETCKPVFQFEDA